MEMICMRENGFFERGEFTEMTREIFNRFLREVPEEVYFGQEERSFVQEDRRHGVRPEEIPGIIGDVTGLSEFNCYPGYPGNICYPVAFFVSLNSRVVAKGRGHLHFQKILDCFIEHMLVKCDGITKNAIMVTDSWDARIAYSKRSFIDKIRKQANVELYILSLYPAQFITRFPI